MNTQPVTSDFDEELFGFDFLAELDREEVVDIEEFKYDPNQPRIPKGVSEEGGRWMDQTGYSKIGEHWVDENGTPLPPEVQQRLRGLRVPPGWRSVRLNPDPEADMLAKGRDSKGRSVYLYSKEHSEEMAAEKFARLKAFNQAMPSVQARALADMNNRSLGGIERDAAAVTYLISRTGFRIGSTEETGAAVKAYGATTLKSEHITIDGSKINFSFIGKKGVKINHVLEDKSLAMYLKGRTGKLFSADDAQVRSYFKSLAGDMFKVKDMRTWKGTSVALQEVSRMSKPTSPTAFKKARLAVAKAVAGVLGNTPTVALKSYIDKAVFARWAI